ncbi:MAG TPA: hypothetical protein VN934_02585 [Candidatus Tumulicola sp.]|nr:hypothetical protein [Candidatus Tumulicola sp.]
MATAPQIDAVNEFQNLFKMLFKGQNWMLALPILIGFIVAGIVLGIVFFIAIAPLLGAAMMSGNNSAANAGAAGLGFLSIVLIGIGCLVAIVLIMLTYAWAIEAAEPMWGGGAPDIGGGIGRAMGKLGPVAIGGGIVAIVMLLLGITFIGPIIWGFFCLYVLPLIVLGNEGGTGAIGASIKLVRENLGPTLMLLLGLIVVGIAGGIVNAILGIIPILGHIVALAVSSVLGAFNVLAIVRWYKLLTHTGTAVVPT